MTCVIALSARRSKWARRKAIRFKHRTGGAVIESGYGIQYFIDKFLVPKHGVQEFKQRMAYNRKFLCKLPGFVEDAAYERTDGNGDLVVVTVATWESAEAVVKAKAAVAAEYQRIGFDAAEMYARLKIQGDRGVYTKVEG